MPFPSFSVSMRHRDAKGRPVPLRPSCCLLGGWRFAGLPEFRLHTRAVAIGLSLVRASAHTQSLRLTLLERFDGNNIIGLGKPARLQGSQTPRPACRRHNTHATASGGVLLLFERSDILVSPVRAGDRLHRGIGCSPVFLHGLNFDYYRQVMPSKISSPASDLFFAGRNDIRFVVYC
ncbi:hypothetical protein BIW11_10834 [Tropilaelaps mercedesae]|uniref:Uncharacterized protein n=1 Tax=Tropilaelaps mercedesae TaxID=418985 RepID=A0A1V9XDU3_9ACAR|nr:hypothetical protein BIW11_10834 [Tropilaelaps mercedesae]